MSDREYSGQGDTHIRWKFSSYDLSSACVREVAARAVTGLEEELGGEGFGTSAQAYRKFPLRSKNESMDPYPSWPVSLFDVSGFC